MLTKREERNENDDTCLCMCLCVCVCVLFPLSRLLPSPLPSSPSASLPFCSPSLPDFPYRRRLRFRARSLAGSGQIHEEDRCTNGRGGRKGKGKGKGARAERRRGEGKGRDGEQCSLDGCILCAGPASPVIGRHSIAAH